MTGQVNLYHIYLGDIATPTRNLVDYFATHLNGSSWLKILSSYYEIDKNGNKKPVSTSIKLTTSVGYALPNSSPLTIADIANTLQALINDFEGTLPIDMNGIYVFTFPGNVPFQGQNNFMFLEDWCSFRVNFIGPQYNMKVIVMGDISFSPASQRMACMSNQGNPITPNNNVGGDNLVNYYAHDLANVMTDAYGAWEDNQTYRAVADYCSWNFGSFSGNSNIRLGNKYFLIQQLWKNGYGCTMSNVITPQPTVAPTVPSPSKANSGSRPSAPTTVLLPTVAPNLPQDISYHGGPVMTGTINLYNLYLGDFISTADLVSTTTILDYFAANIGNTAWFQILSSFYAITGSDVRIPAANMSTLARSVIVPLENVTSLSDEDIQLNIYYAIAGGQFPVDEGGIYTVIFPGYLTVESSVGTFWLSDWCSYHGAFYLPTGQLIKYSVIGDPATATASAAAAVCQPLATGTMTANGNLGADSMASEYAVNLAEIVTDYYGAWYANSSGLETGDLCAGNYGPLLNGTHNMVVGGKPYLVQKLWQPGVGCTLHKIKPPPPSPTVALTSSPSALSTYPPINKDVQYYGGKVMSQNVKLFNIYFGDFKSTDYLRNLTSIVDYFAAHIGSSSWYSILRAYGVTGNATFGGSVFYLPPKQQQQQQQQQLTKGGIESILTQLLSNGSLPASPNYIYAFIFSGNYSVRNEYSGEEWLVNWCTFHSEFSVSVSVSVPPSTQNMKYFVVGDPSMSTSKHKSACEPIPNQLTANRNLGGDSIAYYYANSLANTVSNPDFDGWYFADNSGIGDQCGSFQKTNLSGHSNIVLGNRPYLVQPCWLVKYGCRMSPII